MEFWEIYVIKCSGNIYLLCKLLLCKEDSRVYNIREKQLIKLLSRYLNCPHKDLSNDLEKGNLPLASEIRCDKIYSINKKIIIKKYGLIRKEILKEIKNKLIELI